MTERRPLSLDELHRLSGLPTDPEELAKAKDSLPTADEVMDELGAEFVPSAEAHAPKREKKAATEPQESWTTPADAMLHYAELYKQIIEKFMDDPTPSDHEFLSVTHNELKRLHEQRKADQITDAEFIAGVRQQHTVLQTIWQRMQRRSQ